MSFRKWSHSCNPDLYQDRENFFTPESSLHFKIQTTTHFPGSNKYSYSSFYKLVCSTNLIKSYIMYIHVAGYFIYQNIL